MVEDHPRLFRSLVLDVEWDERLRARKTASFGVPYDYSGMTYPPCDFTESVDLVRSAIAQFVGFEPNNCLANFYPDGMSSMGFHSDSTDLLAPGTDVAIVSLGARRTLAFKRASGRSRPVEFSLPLDPGSLLLMSAEMQKSWLHGLPRDEESEPRISLTSRRIATTE